MVGLGLPRAAARQAGFSEVDTVWQYLDDRIPIAVH